jgi:hypothetical protein
MVRDQATQELEVRFLKYNFYDSNTSKIVEVGMRKKEIDAKAKRAYVLTCDNYNFVRSSGRAWDITAPIRFYGFPDEAVAYYKNSDFLQDLNLMHEKLFSNVYYLGPLRTKAKRMYSWSGRAPDSVGFSGDETIAAILAAENEKRLINLKSRSPRLSFEMIIAKMLKEMKLIEEFKIIKIADNRQDYDVKIKTKGSSYFVNIPDVGFGISQVLPVIVQLFYAPRRSTIIIEQPELHLHPSAQAGLADVIINAIHAKENYKNRNIQLIIETHSEHFLRRFQRRIAEEQLSSDEFEAYFANNDTVPASLDLLQVDLFGDICNWPMNFFGDIAGDVFAQTEAALDRRKKMN